MKNRTAEISDEQTEQLATWFFKVAYSGHRVTPDIERLIRPILARSKQNGDANENEKKYRRSFERYRRLAEWGTDLVLSENNLNGLIMAARVAPLRAGFPDEIRAKCEKALAALQTRKQMSAGELIADSLVKCRKLIEPVWQKSSRGEKCFVEQQDTVALHTCLFGLATKVSATEELADTAQEVMEEINRLRSQFEQVRYPSSTTLLARAKQEIQNLDQERATTIDFAALRSKVAALERRIQQAASGKWGVNRMDKHHVDEALAGIQKLGADILQKEKSPAEFDAEFRLFEADISRLESPQASLTANQIRRLQARVARNSPLDIWVGACFELQADKNLAWSRIEEIKSRLKDLWTRMESQQEQRAAEFREQCLQFEAQIRSSNELQRTWSELRELDRGVNELMPQKRPELHKLIEDLQKTFRQRAADAAALQQLLQRFFDDVDRAKRRIFATIDFEGLNARAVSAQQWAGFGYMPAAELDRIRLQVRYCFAEIRKLRFRQEKAKEERQARAAEVASELAQEIQEVAARIPTESGRPETWQALEDIDRSLRESWHLLSDSQRQTLSEAIRTASQTVRAACKAFAVEATKVFAQYNETLSDTLFGLEDEASKEAAFEAIERIKPIRASLRAEARLLKRQRDELYALLTQISSSIDEVFEQANAKSAQDFNRLRAEMERLDGQIRAASNWQTANAFTETHKQLSAQIRDADLSMASRKECRAEMDRLWDEIKERLQAFRFSRTQTEDLDSLLGRLERQGYLLTVDTVPNIRIKFLCVSTQHPTRNHMATCKECSGKGSVKCPDCGGRGKKDIGFIGVKYVECKHCNGSGRKKCGVCNGRGTI